MGFLCTDNLMSLEPSPHTILFLIMTDKNRGNLFLLCPQYLGVELCWVKTQKNRQINSILHVWIIASTGASKFPHNNNFKATYFSSLHPQRSITLPVSQRNRDHYAKHLSFLPSSFPPMHTLFSPSHRMKYFSISRRIFFLLCSVSHLFWLWKPQATIFPFNSVEKLGSI